MAEKKTTTKKDIHKRMIAVMRDVGAIGKDRQAGMTGGAKYNFRGIDDVYNTLHSIMSKHGIYMVSDVLSVDRSERTSSKGNILGFVTVKIMYSFVAEDGSSVSTTVVGEGMDSGDKATPKALSGAQKYALFQAFLIPTAEAKDAENDSPQLATEAKATATPGGTISDFNDVDPDPQEVQVREIAAEIKVDGERKYSPTQVGKAIQRAKTEGTMDKLHKKMADEYQVQTSGKLVEPEQKELGDADK